MVVPIRIELAAIAVGALSGAVHAIRRGADVIGVLALAIAVGLGGGMLRDVLLSVGPPLALKQPAYLIVVTATALVAMVIGPAVSKLSRVIELVDALLVGIWVVLGIQRARALDLPIPSAIFIGVLTSVGGGVIRDVLVGERTAVFAPGVLYVTPMICGAVAYFVVLPTGHPREAEFAAILFATALRIGALRRGWTLPTPEKLQLTIRRALRRREPSDSRPGDQNSINT